MNNKLDLVSVIIPVYNVEKYVKECITSVLKQDYKDIEIICIDDGSDDLTVSIVRDFAAKDKRVKLFKQSHKNAGAARNLGMQYAKGKFIHFLDGDDWLRSRSVYSKLVHVLNDSNADMCMFSFAEYNNYTNKIQEANLFKDANERVLIRLEDSYSLLCKNNNVIPWNKLYRRDFLIRADAKFDEIYCANDRSFYYQTIVNAKLIAFIKDSMIFYRVGNQSSLAGGGRRKHFDCHIYTSERIMEIVKDCSIEVQKAAINANLSDLFNWYPKIGQEAKQANKSAVIELLSFLEERYQITKIAKANWWYPWFEVMLRQKNLVTEKEVLTVAYFVGERDEINVRASINSLCDHVNERYFYDIYIFSAFSEYGSDFFDCGDSAKCRISCIGVSTKRNAAELTVYAAEYLSCNKNCLCLSPNTIINSDISVLFGSYPEYAVCAAPSLADDRRFDCGVLLVNTDRFVENNYRNSVLQCIQKNNTDDFSVAFNKGVAGSIQKLPQSWNMQVDCKDESGDANNSDACIIQFLNTDAVDPGKRFKYSDLYFKYHSALVKISEIDVLDVQERVFVRKGTDTTCFNRVWQSKDHPAVNRVVNGIVLPAKKIANASYYEGGVCDKNFKFISGLARRDYRKPEWGDVIKSYSVDESMLSYVDECVVFGGVFIGHFGHMVRDNLSRLWWCVQNESSKLKIACIVSFGKVEDYFYEFFDLLNIDRSRVMFITRPTMFKEVIVPEEAVHSGSHYMAEWLMPYDKIIFNIRKKYENAGLPNKIYISKSKYKKSGKATFNEEYFERFYRDRGYTIIHPEEMTVEENISYISNATDIAATVGTTSSLSMFANAGARIELLARVDNYFYEAQCLINEAKKLDWYYIDTSMNFMPCNFFSSRIMFVGASPLWKEYVSQRWGEWSDAYEMDPFACWNYLVKWLQIYSGNPNAFVNEKIDAVGVSGFMQRMCNIILDKGIDESKFASGEPLKIMQNLKSSENIAEQIWKTQANILANMRKKA